MGICWRKASSPRKNAEPVNDTISQFSATACIHVPTLDAPAPNQSSRKSRCLSEAVARDAARLTPRGMDRCQGGVGDSMGSTVGLSWRRPWSDRSRSARGAASGFACAVAADRRRQHRRLTHAH